AALGKLMRARLALATCIAGLAACAVGPDFRRPAAPPAPGYGSAPIQGDTASAPGSAGNVQHFVVGMDIPDQWWILFQSPKLTRLVGQALKANPDVGAAQAALRQAHELYLAQWTALIPLVQGNLSATRSEFP